MNHSDEFLQWNTEFQGRLFSFVMSTLGGVDQANEVLQETNLALWRKPDENMVTFGNVPARCFTKVEKQASHG